MLFFSIEAAANTRTYMLIKCQDLSVLCVDFFSGGLIPILTFSIVILYCGLKIDN